MSNQAVEGGNSAQNLDTQRFRKYMVIILPQIRRLQYGKIQSRKYFEPAETNESLRHNYFCEWLRYAYASQAVMAIRRLTDFKSEKHDQVSLVTLLKELQSRPIPFSREKFIEEEKPEIPRDDEERKISVDIARKADAEFTKMYGPGRHLNIATVNFDLSRITDGLQFKKIRSFADKNYAHTDEDRDKYPIPTYEEINTCVDILTEVYLKYYRLIMGNNYHIDLLQNRIRSDIESFLGV